MHPFSPASKRSSRRALREYGRDASEAHERDTDTVKEYLG